MKKALVLIGVLLTLLLSGCGSTEETPYLNGTQRAEIEKALFASLSVEVVSGDQDAMIFYENKTKYDLADLTVSFPDNSRSVMLSSLPQGTSVRRRLYLQDSFPNIAPGSTLNAVVKYTIGEYSYQSKPKTVPVKALPLPEIVVELENGSASLAYDVPNTFGSTRRLKGLDSALIESLSVTVSSQLGGGFSLIFSGEGGSAAASGTAMNNVIYKLVDQDGIVCDTGDIYCFSGNELHFLGNYAHYPYGKYYLKFLDLGREED